ncbi:hypothetical protein C8J57DRAFT_1391040 [Mycena rebaudengoi]|nr:hypothetical protein C8J57DRAFT_1391040 [Mycena rebaudengoi]
MSFTFHWPRFSDQFHYDAIQMLNTALNKGNKPPIIADKIEVVELEMGTQPPELEIRDIGDLTVDQFRGIFRLTYAGDAHLVLKTKPDIHLMAGSRGMLAAKQALVVPMLLRLSHFKLSSYVVLVVSKQKGITLVFKTDPLQSVDINSTFDSIAVIQMAKLRQMFREDLPGIIHRLSQQWVKAKVETPGTAPTAGLTQRNVGAFNSEPRIPNTAPPSLTRHNVSMFNSASLGLPRTAPLRFPTDAEPVFDPTYGLRPDDIPSKSVFRGFKSLFSPTRGLADLAETELESGTDEPDLDTTYDILDWGAPSSSGAPNDESEYERVPAIGGGTIMRPRIYHSQSQPQPSQTQTQSQPHPPFQATLTSPRPPLSHNPFSAAFASPPSPTSSRSTSPSPSHSLSLSTPPSSASAYQELQPQPLTAHSIHALAMLSHSNHTLSPYTRSLAHFAVRSGPPRPSPPSGGAPTASAGPPPSPAPAHSADAPWSPLDASEFDAADMDMYFRHDLEPGGGPMGVGGDHAAGGSAHHGSPSVHPLSHMRLRHKVSSLSMGMPGV